MSKKAKTIMTWPSNDKCTINSEHIIYDTNIKLPILQ